MSSARKAVPSLEFNGKNVNTPIQDYIESVTYTDVACGDSDDIKLTLHNITMQWLTNWYPKKGDKIKGSIQFRDWVEPGKHLNLSCGTFVLDDIGQSGGPLKATFGGLSIPANDSFKGTARTQTWKNVTIQHIASTIASRYGLGLAYDANSIGITSVEQSDKDDSAFLYELTKKYGLAMKVFNGRLVVYDKGRYEKRNPVATIDRKDFIDDGWDFSDSLIGTYTGARYSYKQKVDGKEETRSKFIGLRAENSSGSRVLKISEEASDINVGGYVASARVNEENEKTTTLTGTIFPNPKIVATSTVNVTGLGKANGKYFVDKVTTEVTGDGTTMSVEMHRCQTRLGYTPVRVVEIITKPKPKTYKVGDIVHFKGGTHYVSSYPGARGYRVGAGTAKITIANGSGRSHPWHLVTQNWSQTHVWGWVDNGTFE